MERTIDLIDGSQVKINTFLSIKEMRKFKERNGGQNKEMLTAMTKNFDPTEFLDKDEVLTSSVYSSYLNANKEDVMSYEEFEERVQFDLLLFIQIFVEVVGGKGLSNQFVSEIDKATKKKA